MSWQTLDGDFIRLVRTSEEDKARNVSRMDGSRVTTVAKKEEKKGKRAGPFPTATILALSNP